MGMSDDFNGSQCEFQNLLLCGGQLGKSIGSIWYNSPVGLWGTNVKYQFAPEWTLGVGVYEVNPDNIKTGKNDGFNLDMNNVKGAIIPVELAWRPKLAAFDGLAGEYKVGALTRPLKPMISRSLERYMIANIVFGLMHNNNSAKKGRIQNVVVPKL